MLVGLPIVVATAIAQSAAVRRPQAEASDSGAASREPTPTPASEAASAEAAGAEVSAVAATGRPWLSWRKLILSFGVALALWGLVVTAYMTMRTLGIGPIGSLVAAGIIDERDRIIIADFDNHARDPLLARAATEAFRIDLAQSPIVRVVDPAVVDQVIARMQRDPDQPLELPLAREVAIREGIKAVIGGEITVVGASFVLSARLVSAESGEALAAYRETAKDSTAIIGAIDRLSKRLRERIGESLKTIRGNEPLDRVTTASLAALRKYSQALGAIEKFDWDRSIALLEEAIALDTAFAMAYRKLGVTLNNIGRDKTRAREALKRAYEHQDRLTDRERYLTLGTYYSSVTDENDKAIAAYQSLLDIYPDDTWALNNLAVLFRDARDYARAEELLARAIELDSSGTIYYGNAIEAQFAQGKSAESDATLERFAEHAPGHPQVQMTAAALAGARFDYDAAETHFRSLREAQRANGFMRLFTSFSLASLAEVRGRLSEAERHVLDGMAAAEEQGLTEYDVGGAIRLAAYDLWFRGRPASAVERLEAALDRYPLASIPPLERPYTFLAMFYCLAERPDQGRAILAEYEATVDPSDRDESALKLALGTLALAEGRPRDAIAEFRLADEGPCPICTLPLLGQAYDLAGEPDSVVAIYERYVTTPWLGRLEQAGGRWPGSTSGWAGSMS